MTVAKDGILTVETFLNVRSAAQIKLGKLTAKFFPLEAMLALPVMLAICVLNLVRRLLLLMSIVPTVIKLIPSRVLKKVFAMVRLLASERVEGNVSESRAGSDTQLILPTSVKAENDRVDNTVKPDRVKTPELVAIEPIVVLDREVKFTASLTVKLPEIDAGPSMLKSPAVDDPTTTLPATVVQSAIWLASA